VQTDTFAMRIINSFKIGKMSYFWTSFIQ